MVSAGKTGTTNDKKDGWFCGFTPYYTTAVWVGYDSPRTVDDLYGSTYPLRIWETYMNAVHAKLKAKDFTFEGTGKTQPSSGGGSSGDDREDHNDDNIGGGGSVDEDPDDYEPGVDEDPDDDLPEPAATRKPSATKKPTVTPPPAETPPPATEPPAETPEPTQEAPEPEPEPDGGEAEPAA